MKNMGQNLLIVKIILKLTALVLLVYFTSSHWFFHKYFFNSLDIYGNDLNSTFVISQLQLIGALSLGFAFLAWIASNDPLKHRVIIQALLLTGSICIAIFFYNIGTGKLPIRFWINAILLAIPLLLVIIFYPWQNHRKDIAK